MMPLLDHSDYDVTQGLRGTPKCTVPGKMQLRIISARYKEGQKSTFYAVNFEVLAHEKTDQAGTEYFQTMPMSGKLSKTTLQLAIAAGALSEEKLQESALGGKGAVDFDLTDGLGKIVYGTMVKGKWNDNDTYRIWDFYGPDDPEAKNYPKASKPTSKDEDLKPEQTGVPVIEKMSQDPASKKKLPF